MSLKLGDFFETFWSSQNIWTLVFVITISLETILPLFISGFSNVFLKVHIILRRSQKYDKIYQAFETISSKIWRLRQILVVISEYMNFEMKQFDEIFFNIFCLYLFSLKRSSTRAGRTPMQTPEVGVWVHPETENLLQRWL